MSFNIEVVKKVPVKVTVQISNEQEKFCQLFARDLKLAGRPFECFMKVYKNDLEPHQTPDFVKKQVKELLTQDNIIQRVNQLLEEDGFNDQNVDKQHLFLINQHADFSTKMKGIEHYNKLKKRTNDAPIIFIPKPIMDWDDELTQPTQIAKEDVKILAFFKTTATKKVLKAMKPVGEIFPARILGVPGGTSASKTVSVIMFIIMLAQKDTTPTLTSIVSESVPHLKRGAIRDFVNIMTAQGYFKQDNWNATDSIYTFENKSKLEFFSSDNGDKLRGARRDRLFINEANNVTFDAFEQLEVRTKQFVILDWNPTSEFWYYTEVKKNRTDWQELTLTYKDNEALDQRIVESIEQRKGRKGWWTVYGLGELG